MSTEVGSGYWVVVEVQVLKRGALVVGVSRGSL